MNPKLATVYRVRVKGHLSDDWSTWFDDLSITKLENGDTLISGPIEDQAALYGLLTKVRDLGLSLLAVNRVESNKK